ncbi:MAG: Asp23/Gls24 family envelope stress response protein [Firmicutes bacterium]|nr:Asp23/Gls24 family envelope stress response protein [Bacillota bacterium]
MENDYQEPTYDTEIGDIKIDDEVSAVCAANATLSTAGVHALAGGVSNQISKTILRKDIVSKGIKVTREDEVLVLDVFIIVKFGFRIPDVAFNLQKNISGKIREMTDMEVSAVNVHVQGVDIEEEE